MINFVCQLPLGQLDGDNQTDENRREREREKLVGMKNKRKLTMTQLTKFQRLTRWRNDSVKSLDSP